MAEAAVIQKKTEAVGQNNFAVIEVGRALAAEDHVPARVGIDAWRRQSNYHGADPPLDLAKAGLGAIMPISRTSA